MSQLSEYDKVAEDGSILRYCPLCRTYKDRETEFNKAPGKNHKRELCAVCWKVRNNEKRGKLLKAACTSLMKQLVRGQTVEHIEVPHTSELASLVVENLGGAAGFARMISDSTKAAYDLNPAGKQAYEWAKLSVNLVIRSTEQRETAPDVAQMNEEELNTELTSMIAKLLDNNPDLLEEVAQARLEDDSE